MRKLLGAIVMISLSIVVHNSCGGGGGGGPDTQAPTGVLITGGITAGQVVSGVVLLTATAQDNSGSIQKIEFYVATNPVLACVASGPKSSGQNFSCNWDSRAVADGPHTVTAKAYDAAGNTAQSPGINILVNNAPPSAPTGVQAVPGNGQVSVSWNSVAGATSYNIYWRTSPGVTKQNGTKVAGVASPYIHTGLTNGTPYYYVVTAVNANGESAESGEVSATPTAWVVADLYSTTNYNSVKYINLVKAPNELFHLAFYDGSQGPMWAVSSGSNPSGLGAPSPIEEVSNRNGNYGLDLSFAVSADNEPSAGYNYGSASRLPVYTSRQQDNWFYFRGLGPFQNAGYHTSLIRSGIPGEGNDFLAYADYSNPAAGYVATITHCTALFCELPRSLGVEGLAYSALAIGGNADPVLIFYLTPGANSSLQLVVCPGMTCSGTPAPVTLKTGLGSVDLSTPPLRSVIIGNAVWVVFAGTSPASLKCTASSRSAIPAECANPTNWVQEQISTESVTWVSLAVNSSTNLPIVAYETSAHEIKYAGYSSGWGTPETLVSGLSAGSGYPAIGHYMEGPNGFVSIVFFDAGKRRIRIGTRPQ